MNSALNCEGRFLNPPFCSADPSPVGGSQSLTFADHGGAKWHSGGGRAGHELGARGAAASLSVTLAPFARLLK